MRHLICTLFIFACAWAIELYAQTPYDSFSPETSRPMLGIAETESQTDSILCAVFADMQNQILLLVDVSNGEVLAAAPITDEVLKWMSVDPLADKYPGVSPYAYCGWNPINAIDPDGRRPIYSTDGELLGTDDAGLQGQAVVMDSKFFEQNMPQERASAFDLGVSYLSEEAFDKYSISYNALSSRPDWDGYISLREANTWYRIGEGEPLYADLGKIDLSGIRSLGEKYVGQKKSFNLLTTSSSIETGLVYGNITLKRYPNHQVRAYSDMYNFEMHPWTNPLNWGRNIETIIGNKVAGNGVPFDIHFYGTQTLTPILPWIK